MPIDAKGTYSLETKPCGCRIKRYRGGKPCMYEEAMKKINEYGGERY